MRYLTAGESHGKQLTTIVEGVPALMPLTSDEINESLLRRQKDMAVVSGCKLKRT